MTRRLFAAAVLSIVATAVPSFGAVDTVSLLRNLYDVSSLPTLTDSKSAMFSSYDRSGGNADLGNYLAKSEDGTALLAEMKGPGAIVRIWSMNPSGTLKIYVDGSTAPVISTPFKDFFTDPELQPINRQTSDGYVGYLPIPYAKSCRVVVEHPSRLYYQINYRTFASGTEVRSFTGSLGTDAENELRAAIAAWKDTGGEISKSAPFAPGGVSRSDDGTVTVAPGKTEQALSVHGAGCIDEFAVSVYGAEPIALRQAIVRMYWDGESSPSVEAPLLDFFGNAFREMDYSGLVLGESPTRDYCRFPMPFGKSARIEIENGGRKPLDFGIRVDRRELASLPPDTGRFHAKWHRATTKEGEPYLVLEARGKGRFVGASLTVQGESGFWYVKGDDMVYVDGEKTPSIHGTGTDDYFNCGSYFGAGPISQPLYGALISEREGASLGAYRFHIPDYIDYRKWFRFELEHGRVNNYMGADYSTVAYFYSKEPHYDFFKMPQASSIGLPRQSIASSVSGAMEAENLNPKAENGKMQIKSWEELSRDWRGGKVVVFTPSRKGAALVVPVNVQYRDRYAISAYLVRGSGFGRVVAEIDGASLPDKADLSSDSVPEPAPLATFGDAVLTPGQHTIKLIPEPTADGKAMIGLDRIALVSQSPFVANWYLLGPFDYAGLDAELAPEKEPFNASAVYSGKLNRQVKWQEINIADKIWLMDLLTPSETTVAYAFTHIISPDERKVDMLFGADDALKVFLNGKGIWQNPSMRSLVVDKEHVLLDLKAGDNTLLLKIGQGGGRWGFVVRPLDPNRELKYSARGL